MVSPGVQYLAHLLPKLFAVPFLLHVASKIWTPPDASLLNERWVWVLVLLTAGPLSMYLKGKYSMLRNKRRAIELGAIEIPLVEGKWPGSVDLLYQIITSFKTEYVCEFIGKLLSSTPRKTIRLRILWEDEYFTYEPRYIKQVLVGNFHNYEKGKMLFGEATETLLGSGIFNADGTLWKFHRSLTRPFFSRERVARTFGIFDRHSVAVLSKMREHFQNGIPMDFQDAMARFTLDTATEFLLGRRVHSISEPFLAPGGVPLVATAGDAPHNPAQRFVKAFGRGQLAVSLRIRMGDVWKLFEIRSDKVLACMKDINEFLDPILDDALERGKNEIMEKRGEKTVDEETIFLEHMMTQTQDRKILRDSIMNMLIAGRDTTASFITFVVYMLSQHPKVLEKLREEIKRSLGQKIPIFDDIREMKYLRAVLNETLRLFPPVPFNMRDTIQEDVWTATDGTRYYVAPNTSVGYSVLDMHRDEALWGKDALEFDPERWLDQRAHKVADNPFMFLPFHAGPRICLGQLFAHNETSFMVIRLLQTFSTIRLAPEAQPPGSLPPSCWDPSLGRNAKEKIWPRSHLTLFVEGGLWLTMSEVPDV